MAANVLAPWAEPVPGHDAPMTEDDLMLPGISFPVERLFAWSD